MHLVHVLQSQQRGGASHRRYLHTPRFTSVHLKAVCFPAGLNRLPTKRSSRMRSKKVSRDEKRRVDSYSYSYSYGYTRVKTWKHIDMTSLVPRRWNIHTLSKGKQRAIGRWQETVSQSTLSKERVNHSTRSHPPLINKPHCV